MVNRVFVARYHFMKWTIKSIKQKSHGLPMVITIKTKKQHQQCIINWRLEYWPKEINDIILEYVLGTFLAIYQIFKFFNDGSEMSKMDLLHKCREYLIFHTSPRKFFVEKRIHIVLNNAIIFLSWWKKKEYIMIFPLFDFHQQVIMQLYSFGSSAVCAMCVYDWIDLLPVLFLNRFWASIETSHRTCDIANLNFWAKS